MVRVYSIEGRAARWLHFADCLEISAAVGHGARKLRSLICPRANEDASAKAREFAPA